MPTSSSKKTRAAITMSDVATAVRAATDLTRIAGEVRACAVGAVSDERAMAPTLLGFTTQTLVESIVADRSLMQRVSELEEKIRFTVAPRTRSGQRLQSLRGQLAEVALDNLRPDPGAAERTVQMLEREGLKVLRVGRFGITVEGPARLVSSVVGAELGVGATRRSASMRATRMFDATSARLRPSDLFVAPRTSLTVSAARHGSDVHDFVFVPSPLLFAPAQTPPPVTYPHLVESDVQRLLNVPNGLRGKGIRVAMIDTGFDASHPYYLGRGLKLVPSDTSTGPDAHIDTSGHGTSVAWNVFAVAAECEVLGFKNANPLQDAIEAAADSGAKIISCSWGWDHEQSFPQLEASIRDVIQSDGCIVLFAAGNGQYAWPGSMPEVISVGGVYAEPAAGALEASNYASGFSSSLYPGRRVPDVCGLCGQMPAAVYLPMPSPAACEMDQQYALQYPDGDNTAPDDGWIYASGTSSATPQVAGVVALMLEHAQNQGKTLSCASVRGLLERSSTPVQAGRNAFGFPAQGHPNSAVGYGLVNSAAAIGLI